MKKNTQIMIGVLILVGVLMMAVVGMYNGLIQSEVEVDAKWAQVETDYQRRADLVPQLIATVKGAAEFEKTTLENVTKARTAWLGAGSLESKMNAAKELDSAIASLLVTVESYPSITATENFQTLQSQLEGTENRISVARKRYNDAVAEYNKMIRVVPKNIIARMFGFDAKDFFEALEGADKAPEVEFDFN